MKALSIKEPWISLIASGDKTIETRTWKPEYRGRILLVGSKKPSGPLAGLAACRANLIDCRPMTKADEVNALCKCYPGAISWILEDIELVPEPFGVRGQLRLYDVNVNCHHIGLAHDWYEPVPDYYFCSKCSAIR